MPVRFGNCSFRYTNPNGKHVFVPSDEGRKIGKRLKLEVERRFTAPEFYYHLRRGGHVAALHRHRAQKYFARLDIENFFYSVSRNRVARSLQALRIPGSENYAKWSTVKNPRGEPSYALPYGFIQSPLLASLVFARSPVGIFLEELTATLQVSVYVDDIALSGNNKHALERAYRKLRRKMAQSNFAINNAKSAAPGLEIELFNCHLTRMESAVLDERRTEFYAIPRSDRSVASFEAYCASVEA